jgi:tetratricopeptide (TPR) repeat protein|tara:strand:- start:1877 stop:2515 length:639 start_codon:yes stop_codon:yes gene_type:complete
MDLKNLTELELYFSNHFDTVLFPVLAEIYQTKGEYDRAKRVCEIGLGHNPDCLDGYYILSQAEMGLGNLSMAEKWMKKVLNQDPSHKSAASGLPMVQEQLKRSAVTLNSSWKKALKVDPNNQFAKDYLNSKKNKKNTVLKKTNKEKPPKKNKKDLNIENVTISPRLATFTLVRVLKSQGLYYQALDILDILAERGENKKKIAKERKLIKAEL